MTPEIIESPCLVLVGPTAIGKTDLSLSLARLFGCEIVSVDSMQVYRYLDIGTAKASLQERAETPHHLIDIVDPDEPYDAARFAADALQAIREIHGRGKIPLLTGGTGLYLRTLFEGIFPGVAVDEHLRQRLQHRLATEENSILHEELSICDSYSAKRINVNDSQRLLRALEVYYTTGVPWSEHLEAHQRQAHGVHFAKVLQLGLTTDRETLYQRINVRCQTMLDNGLENEVRNLLAMGYARDLKVFGAIGYRHILQYIDGTWSKEEAGRLLARDTRRYAKRQYTWFGRLTDLHWFDVNEHQPIFQTVASWLELQSQR